MSETIKATFGVDITPLQRGFAQAEQAAKTSAAKVSSALNSVQTTAEKIGRRPTFRPFGQAQFEEFARSQGPRTAANFRPAPRGKYPTPSEESDGNRRGLSGIGLGRGLAVFGVVHQLIQAFIQANEEAEKLTVTISKLTAPSGASAFRSGSGIQSNLTGITQQLDELNERTGRESSTEGGVIGNVAGWIKRKTRQILTGMNDAKDEHKRGQLRQQAIEDIDAMVSKQNELNKAEGMSLNGSEREAKILEAQIAHREKLGALAALEAAANVKGTPLQNAENARFQNEVARMNRDTGPAAIISPKRLVASPGAYLRHPDAYDTGATRTDNDKMISARRSGLDWFKEHPRDFGFNTPRTFLKSDENSYYNSKSAQGPRFGPLGLGAMRKDDIASFGAGSFMDRPSLTRFSPDHPSSSLTLGDKAEGAKDLSALVPLVQNILTAINKGLDVSGANK